MTSPLRELQNRLGCQCAPDDGDWDCPVHGLDAPVTVGTDGVRRFADGTVDEYGPVHGAPECAADVLDFLETVGEVNVFEFEHGGEDYMVVCDEGPTCFVYVAAEVAQWMENYEPNPDDVTKLEIYSRAYQDFCETCDTVEDEDVARVALAKTGCSPMRAGSCTPILTT